MLNLFLAILAYALAFHFSYISYINPNFEYAYFLYTTPSLENILITYSLILFPIFGYKTSSSPASYGAALIFSLCYIPAILVMLFMWSKSNFELILIQTCLAISMFFLLLFSSYGWNANQKDNGKLLISSKDKVSKIIAILTISSLLLLIINYHQYMRLVTFNDVYDIRSESSTIDIGLLSGYSIMWLNYSLLPFYLAKGIIEKNYIALAIVLIGCLLIYMATGAKAAILMPIIIYIMHSIRGLNRVFLFKLLVGLCIIILCITLAKDIPLVRWALAILLIRVLAVGGWTITTYYEYFTTYGYTYYTHISPIKALTDAYPYGQYSLGQVIGIEYSGSAEANWNANFWASDAIAALGIPGIPVVTIALSIVFYLINKISNNFSSNFISLWLSGFWLALLNIPLSTALLSGGGLMTIVLLWITSHSTKPVIRIN